MNVNLRGKTKEIVQCMVEEGYANSQSEAVRLALVNFGEHHLKEIESINRKLDKIDLEIKSGKRKLLNSKAALGEFSKFLK